MADHKLLFIPDASVLLKWIVPEDDHEQALLFREDLFGDRVEVEVPAHCFTEICNMLGREKRHEAIDFLSFLFTADILQGQITLEIAAISFDLMRNYEKVSFYDAIYHAHAIHEKGTFLTADEKYYAKTKKEGHVMLLKDYGKKR